MSSEAKARTVSVSGVVLVPGIFVAACGSAPEATPGDELCRGTALDCEWLATADACESQLGCLPATQCSGVPYPCILHDEIACQFASGCGWTTDCFGVASSCASFSTALACTDQIGCYWDSSAGACDGSAVSCAGADLLRACASQAGCTTGGGCVGFEAACETQFTEFFCVEHGCSWSFEGCDGFASGCETLSETACLEQVGCDASGFAAACGDGLPRGDETCDDGNRNWLDGCDGNCQADHGFTCRGEPSVCSSRCGDGVVALFEECDDGGTSGFDGCNERCRTEFGFTCSGEPSACAPN